MTSAKNKYISPNFILRLSYSDCIDSHNLITYFHVDAIISECRLLKTVAKSYIYITGPGENLTHCYVDK